LEKEVEYEGRLFLEKGLELKIEGWGWRVGLR
jgi:hypothetical protein